VAYGALYIALGAQVEWLNSLGFLGVGSVAVLGVATIWSEGGHRAQARDAFLLAILFPAFLEYSGFALACTLLIHPRTLALYLYAFDGRLGFQSSFAVGRLFQSFGLLRQISYVAYEMLPLAMAFAFSMERGGKRRHTADIVTAFLGAAIAGYVIYNVFPAAGPIHVFGDHFPFAPPPAPVPVPVGIAGARNAMPSVHLAMALLIFWHSRQWNRVPRLFAGMFLVLTVLATLGFGEHYLIDLVVAVPFALAMEAIATSDSPQIFRHRLAFGLAATVMVAGWIVYLRLAPVSWPSPALLWGAIAITVVSSILMERALNRAARLP